MVQTCQVNELAHIIERGSLDLELSPISPSKFSLKVMYQNLNKNCWKQKTSMFYQQLPLQRQKRKPRLHLVRRRGVKEVRVTPVKVATGILPLTFLEPVTTWQDMCANSWKRCWRWYTIHIGIHMFNSSESTVHCLHICYKDVFEGRVRQVDTLSWKFRDDSLRREDKTDVWSESNTLSLPWSYMCLVAYSVLSYFETSDKQVISFQGVMRKP